MAEFATNFFHISKDECELLGENGLGCIETDKICVPVGLTFLEYKSKM
jgi:hypothetical protein